MENVPDTPEIDNDLMQHVGLTPRQIALLVSLPTPLKRDAFRLLLNLATKREVDVSKIKSVLGICLMFSAAQSAAPLKQAKLTT